MSIQSEIDRINSNISDTYSVLSDLGSDLPSAANSDNLADTAANVKAVLYNKNQSLTELQKEQARKNIGVTNSLLLFCTISKSAWFEEEDYYVATIEIPEIGENDTPLIDISTLDIPDDINRGDVFDEWICIDQILTFNGSVNIYATDLPTLDLPIRIKII